MNFKRLITALLVVFTLGIIYLVMPKKIAEPSYTVVETHNTIEIREYAPYLTAEVEQSGKRKEAINAGFRLLADYIFGNNTKDSKISMTAPVIQESSQRIAMTAPVTQSMEGDKWTVRFVMPAEFKSLNDLPRPNNPAVKLLPVPSKKVAVIRFSGLNSDANLSKHEDRLRDFLKENKLQAIGNPTYAFYNPPWTLPMMRRNEVQIQIR